METGERLVTAAVTPDKTDTFGWSWRSSLNQTMAIVNDSIYANVFTIEQTVKIEVKKKA